MEVDPGAEAQVDFGQGAWVLVEGKRKRPHLFRIVLRIRARATVKWSGSRQRSLTSSVSLSGSCSIFSDSFHGFVMPPSQKTGKYLSMMAEARERQR